MAKKKKVIKAKVEVTVETIVEERKDETVKSHDVLIPLDQVEHFFPLRASTPGIKKNVWKKRKKGTVRFLAPNGHSIDLKVENGFVRFSTILDFLKSVWQGQAAGKTRKEIRAALGIYGTGTGVYV